MKQTLTILIGITTLAVAATGCATRGFVRQEIGDVYQRADSLETQTETQIEQVQKRLNETDARVAAHGDDLDAVSGTAMKALERAVAAGKLAEGKLLYETTLTDSDYTFGFEKAELGEQARAALDQLATWLKAENRNVYLEIQGHTDSSGPEDYNLMLGEKRAEAASRYLNMEHHIPLHRMSTISYGESAPVADNSTREGRALNRRVVIVVLS
jgi:peptidoglycan-associated lipoprotein